MILVPAKELPVGTKLEKEKLAWLIRKKWVNITEVPPDAILNENELFGRTAITTLGIGDCFTVANVLRFRQPCEIAGKQSYTLKLPYECVGPWVQPGSVVAVVCTHRPPESQVFRQVQILQKMAVVAVDYFDKPEVNKCKSIHISVTLMASLEEAYWMQVAQDAGAWLRLLTTDGCEKYIKLSDDELYELFKSIAKESKDRQDGKK